MHQTTKKHLNALNWSHSTRLREIFRMQYWKHSRRENERHQCYTLKTDSSVQSKENCTVGLFESRSEPIIQYKLKLYSDVFRRLTPFRSSCNCQV